uniref:Uncharacterized protein n=1 Tax=Oryza barthii TaxID=65489 RepID=A0A0D3GYQ7_9ORYZ
MEVAIGAVDGRRNSDEGTIGGARSRRRRNHDGARDGWRNRWRWRKGTTSGMLRWRQMGTIETQNSHVANAWDYV